MKEMEVDEEMYPLENHTNFDEYSQLKPPEGEEKSKKEKEEAVDKDMPEKATAIYKTYKPFEKKGFLSCQRKRYEY